MIDRFANVMQQSGPFGQRNIHAQFRRHHSGQMRNFNRMFQYVLAIAGTILQTAQQSDQFRVQTMDTRFKGCLFSGVLDPLFHFPLRFFDSFFNPCGMNAAITDQFFQGNPGDFPSNRIKTGDKDRFRGIVNNQINPGQRFQGPNVSALPANNSPFHFVVGQTHYRNSGFCSMISSTALNRQRNNFTGFFLGFFLRLVLQIFDQNCHFMTGFLLNIGKQNCFGFFLCQTGQTFQFVDLLLKQFIDLRLFAVYFQFTFADILFLFLHGLNFSIQVLFFLLQAAFHPLNFGAAFLEFTLGFRPKTMNLLFGFNQGFFLSSIRAVLCIVENFPGGLFRRSDLGFRQFFSNPITGSRSDCRGNQYKD